MVGVPPNAVMVDAPEIECQKCGWLGDYDDLIAPTSDREPSCPECLGDDFLEVDSPEDDGLRVCDFCLRSEAETSPIRKTGDDEGLMVCVDCEEKYLDNLNR